MRRGFTLIEMLVILVFISFIALMAIPNITALLKKEKEDEYLVFLNNVFLATEAYIEKYKDDYPSLSMIDSTTYIYMKDLVDEKLISTNLVNPKYCVNNSCTSKRISTCSNKTCSIDDYTILVTKDEDGKYKYDFKTGFYEAPEPKVVEPVGPKSFSTDSWEVIINAVRNNNTSAYHVGDTKEIDLGDLGIHTVRIANMSTPNECSTTGFSQTACGFVLEFSDVITKHNMNSTNTNVGGWPATSMRQYVNSDIYNSLPSDLKDGIIDTFVVSGHGKNDSTNFTSTDKLYLLSTKEVWGKEGTSNKVNYDTAEAETRQLDYYKNNGVTTNNYSGAIKKLNGNAIYWWLRAPISNYTDNFYRVYTSGDWNSHGANYAIGAAPAFRIG